MDQSCYILKVLPSLCRLLSRVYKFDKTVLLYCLHTISFDYLEFLFPHRTIHTLHILCNYKRIQVSYEICQLYLLLTINLCSSYKSKCRSTTFPRIILQITKANDLRSEESFFRFQLEVDSQVNWEKEATITSL